MDKHTINKHDFKPSDNFKWIVIKVFENYSYKECDYYKIIAQGLIKNQACIYNCHSVNDVLMRLGFIGKKTKNITKSGKQYLYDYFYDEDMAV